MASPYARRQSGFTYPNWNRSDMGRNETSVKVETQTNKSYRKDIWTLIKEEKELDQKNTPDENVGYEWTGLFVGSKNSGKTSMILRFLDREEIPNPSIGLEYTFGRKTRSVNATKDIAHIWELAGGTFLSKLMDIPMTEFNIHSLSTIIVVDLSEPWEVLNTLDHFIENINTRSNNILENLTKRGSKRPAALKALAEKRYDEQHPDSERRKLMGKVLRFWAHKLGGSLIYTSLKDETLMTKCRQVLSHFLFKSPCPKTLCTDYNKPLFMMAGSDTFSDIGFPPTEAASINPDIPTATLSQKAAQSTFESWKKAFEKYFPIQEKQSQVTYDDFSKFPEPNVDAMRAQKDEELERYRRLYDRKARDLQTAGNPFGLNAEKAQQRRHRSSREKLNTVPVSS